MRRAHFCLPSILFARFPTFAHKRRSTMLRPLAINMQRIPIYHGMLVRYTGINDISASSMNENRQFIHFSACQTTNFTQSNVYGGKKPECIRLGRKPTNIWFSLLLAFEPKAPLFPHNQRGRMNGESEQWISHVRPEPYEWICWPETVEIPPPDLIPI